MNQRISTHLVEQSEAAMFQISLPKAVSALALAAVLLSFARHARSLQRRTKSKELSMKNVGYFAFLLAAALTACSGASNTVPMRDDSSDTLPSPSNLTPASAKMRLYVSGRRGINV